MEIPEWADEQLSVDLPVLRARGENQDLEYMESFPQNVRELSKEIAAFATANQGTILIGVSDVGDLVGLEDAQTPEGRDALLRRIEGICRGTIKPAITPTVKFAIEDTKAILVIIIPKGSQPVYYSHNIPYIRHITESRPAKPHEVVELVRGWLPVTSSEKEKQDPFTNLLSYLAPILFDVLIYADETDERSINPWLEMWRAQFQQTAVDLRELAIQDAAVEHGMSNEINELAQALDEVATFRLYLGCGDELSELVRHVRELAIAIKNHYIDPIPLSEALLQEIKQTIISSERKLRGLIDRSGQMVEQGRIEEFQTEASDIGQTLLSVSHYNITSLQKGLSQRLQTVGRNLHLVETMRIYMDGGQSLNAVVERVRNCYNELSEITLSLYS